MTDIETRTKYHKRTPADSRKILLSAAIVLFLERGFTGATAKDISHKAGYTTGAMLTFTGVRRRFCLI